MATTKGRQGSHGKAYSEYAGLKEKAIYIGGEHLDCDTLIDSSTPDMEEIWYEFEQEGSMFPNIKNTCIMLESSPTPEEMQSMGINSDEETLTKEQKDALMQYAQDLLDNMDAQEINYNYVVHVKQKDANGKVILDNDGNPVTKDEIRKGVVPKTKLRNSKWFCMLHRDSKSGIWHLHILASRFTKDGLEQNDPRLVAKRAARATEMLNRVRGWKSAERISSHHQNEIKDTIYDVLRKMDKFSWNDFKDAMEARTFTDYKGRKDNYELMFRNDSQGNVVGYSVWRGNSNYNASMIGKQLTASRLYNTWLKLQNEQRQTRPEQPKSKPAQTNTYKPSKPVITDTEKKRQDDELYRRLMEQKKLQEKAEREAKANQNRNSQRPEAVESRNFLQKWVNSSFSIFDRDDQAKVTPGIVARCLDMGLDSRNINNLMTAAEDFAKSFEGAAERIATAVLECKDTVDIIGMFLPPATPSVGGGGGGQDTGGWRDKKDDDDWKWWLKNGFAAMRSRGKGIR